MATSLDFIEYVAAQANGCGYVRYKKMFGEYMVYIDDKPVLLVCDNSVFVKILPCLDELMRDAERGHPYDGAKEHYVLDIDDAELTRAVISALKFAAPRQGCQTGSIAEIDDYGASKVIQSFDKIGFLETVKTDTDSNHFENYRPLIEKIEEILAATKETIQIEDEKING